MLLFEEITADIIESAQRIHREIGPGLFESVYRRVMADDLIRKGRAVEFEKACRITFEGRTFKKAFRADLVVDGKVLIEAKSKERLAAIHFTQLLTYLRLLKMKVGLLINFGETSLVVRRIVN